MVSHFISKTVPFKFRGIDFTFDLSQGLFSSADVDKGTRLLLKVFSRILDEDSAAGKSPPLRILDSGCGAGIIGICAAAAISPLVKDNNGVLVRCQDRDELARLITAHNAAQNVARYGVSSTLEAHTEPLLAGPLDARWDMILTNIPAKAGTPVLEDFVRRSAGLLNPGGRVIMVAVRALADFFRERITAEAELFGEERGGDHHVFVYGKTTDQVQSNPPSAVPVNNGTDFVSLHPFYVRAAAACIIEDIPVRLTTVHGAGGFDNPGGAVLSAAKLVRRLGLRQLSINDDAPLLVHEPGQGFFPCWLLEFLRSETKLPQPPILSGRNILALQASRHNVQYAGTTTIVPATDLRLGETALREATGGRRYGCIAAFPELLPQSSLPKNCDQLAALWDALPPLLAGGGIFLAAFGSSDAERFDRKKPAGFTRVGSIKRSGFRALAYRLN